MKTIQEQEQVRCIARVNNGRKRCRHMAIYSGYCIMHVPQKKNNKEIRRKAHLRLRGYISYEN